MNKKSALWTVFLVVLVDLMGFGIVLPLLPFYAEQFHASAISIGLLYSVYSLAQLVFSPIWGGISDRVGRKPIMLLSTLGASAAYILFAFSHSFTILFLSRLLAGIMGGNIATAQAYVADITTPEERAKGMGLLGAAFGIGFVLGPAMASFLIHPNISQVFTQMGFDRYALPGFFAAALSICSFILVFFHLPETIGRSEQPKSDSVRITRISLFSAPFWRGIRENKKISVLLLSLGQSSLYSAFPLFCSKVIGLSPEKVGMQFAAMGLVAIFIQGGMIRHLAKRFKEEHLFLVGCILMTIGFALLPLARSEKILMLYLSIVGIGASLNGPTLNSLISKDVDPLKVGSAMGSAQGFSALGRVIGPTWGGVLFGISFQLPFWLTAAVLSVTILIGWRLQKLK